MIIVIESLCFNYSYIFVQTQLVLQLRVFPITDAAHWVQTFVIVLHVTSPSLVEIHLLQSNVYLYATSILSLWFDISHRNPHSYMFYYKFYCVCKKKSSLYVGANLFLNLCQNDNLNFKKICFLYCPCSYRNVVIMF